MKKRLITLPIIVMLATLTASSTVQAAAITDKTKDNTPISTAPERMLLDINTAPADWLMELPGIGDTSAREIIARRPYQSKDELVRENIISQASYDQIKDLIIAKQTKESKEATDLSAQAGTSDVP
jgi:competence protein ComEA